MQERSGILGGQFRELLLDESNRSRLPGREHGAMRGLSQGLVLLPEQRIVQMFKRHLLGDYGDVVLPCVGYEFGCLRWCDGATWRCNERVGNIRCRVCEIRRVEIDLV